VKQCVTLNVAIAQFEYQYKELMRGKECMPL